MIRRLTDALLHEEREVVWSLATEHLRATGSRLAVFADILHPAQERLAELWYSSRVGHADEARAAGAVLAITRRLPPTPVPAPVPHGSGCILTALPTERHTLGLEMLRAALEDDGWAVDMVLGDELEGLLDHVGAFRPRFVGVTAGWLEAASPMAALIEAVHGLGVPVLVGGQAFNRAPDLWRRLEADGWGPDLRVALVLARRALRGGGTPSAGAA
ncbi:MAG TPA: cobalamin B12-binding domain-containing protein [Candidatus Dormibacteraeota bacterium]|nr:cobalamin B12-binding domain-containing protein [Candidatus Dormibacteraeota bacterium]